MSASTGTGVQVDPTRGRPNSYGLLPGAHAITAFRALPNGAGRQYTGTTWLNDPWGGVEHAVRTGHKLGFLKASSADQGSGYAVLDVLDQAGEVIQDFEITTARAFQWMKKRCGWTVAEGSP
jgi:hypothetical protein